LHFKKEFLYSLASGRILKALFLVLTIKLPIGAYAAHFVSWLLAIGALTFSLYKLYKILLNNVFDVEHKENAILLSTMILNQSFFN